MGLENTQTNAWLYMAIIQHAKQESLFHFPLLKEELAQATRVAEERGVDWLSAKHTELGLPRATPKQFQDFLNVLKMSQALLGRCADCGHVRALGDGPHTELGLEPQHQGSVTRTIERYH
jgi:hypothetical protein